MPAFTRENSGFLFVFYRDCTRDLYPLAQNRAGLSAISDFCTSLPSARLNMLADWSTPRGRLHQNFTAPCCRRVNRFGKGQTSRTFFAIGLQERTSRGSRLVTNQSGRVSKQRFSQLLNNACRKRYASIVRATNPRERLRMAK